MSKAPANPTIIIFVLTATQRFATIWACARLRGIMSNCGADFFNGRKFVSCNKTATHIEETNGKKLKVCTKHAKISQGHGLKVVRI